MKHKPSNSDWPWLWFFTVKSDGAIGLPIYDFLVVFNSNIWPYVVSLSDTRLHNLCDRDTLNFQDDSSSDQFQVPFGLPIYEFLLVYNSNMRMALLCIFITLIHKPSNYRWPWLWPFKVKSDSTFRFPIYDFLLESNRNHMFIPHWLPVYIGTWKFPPFFLSLSLIIVPKFQTPHPTLTLGWSSHNPVIPSMGQRKGSSPI